MESQARRSSPPNRVRYPTDQQFASGCSPPRLTATQLPSTTEFVAYSDTDFHRADVAPSRAHDSRVRGNDESRGKRAEEKPLHFSFSAGERKLMNHFVANLSFDFAALFSF